MFPQFCSSLCIGMLKGKGSGLGVGRGRAVAMRARVRFVII